MVASALELFPVLRTECGEKGWEGAWSCSRESGSQSASARHHEPAPSLPPTGKEVARRKAAFPDWMLKEVLRETEQWQLVRCAFECSLCGRFSVPRSAGR